LAVAEARILPVLDSWLARLFDPDHVDETIDTLLVANRTAEIDPPALVAARGNAAEAQTRLGRYLSAIDAGVDPNLLVEQTRQAQTELARATGIIAAHAARTSMTDLTPSTIRTILLRHDGFPGLLRKVATPDERRILYAELGITLTYERRASNGQIKELVRPTLSVPENKVGAPWSYSACRRGDLNPHVLADTSPSAGSTSFHALSVAGLDRKSAGQSVV
jgi:hypothetical protein